MSTIKIDDDGYAKVTTGNLTARFGWDGHPNGARGIERACEQIAKLQNIILEQRKILDKLPKDAEGNVYPPPSS
ncbi:hypothetical protein LCGC14_0248500 [marine sediment metagenome]|uniref:Uncharacterized protein n=1 Tax=marine sediment metagenome TaxID=412755 RepID=A0A0F9X9M3_9ZZZZ